MVIFRDGGDQILLSPMVIASNGGGDRIFNSSMVPPIARNGGEVRANCSGKPHADRLGEHLSSVLVVELVTIGVTMADDRSSSTRDGRSLIIIAVNGG